MASGFGGVFAQETGGLMEAILNFISKHWISILVIVVIIIGALIYFGVGVFKSAKNFLVNSFGNPETDQTITGTSGEFHTNVFDASLATLTGGTQSQVTRTRTDEVQGLFQAAEGDRSWADLWDNPIGFGEFFITGNDSYLTGAK